jgi:5,5'-dehydrodivanillate O-demethylase
MLSEELNDLVTHVGPGTPGGEFQRRYWHPISLSSQVTAGGQPKQVRILGEDLVLFRDDQGRPGLLGVHCSHRLVSLAYGRPEDGGLRCSMHGWVYDVNGRCLEQPAEPDETFKDRIEHLAYPCQDLGGLIFAYLGPKEKQPLLPSYEELVRTDGTRQCTYYPIRGGYLQHLEGAWDTVHAEYLHMGNWSTKKHELALIPKPIITYAEADYGLRQCGEKPHPGGATGRSYGYFFMPTGWLRLSGQWENVQLRSDRVPTTDIQKFMSWYTPVDDGHTLRFQVSFAAFGLDGSAYPWRPDGIVSQPGADEDYGRDFDHVDSISGIDPSNQSTFRAQDTMANETQGLPYLDRTREHLGAHDTVLMALRMMILKGIADVQNGVDPKHVIRDPELNEVVYVRGDEPMEYFAAERAAMAVGSR